MLQALDRINLSLASPRSSGENTLNMLEIMTRAFDESEGIEWEEQDPEPDPEVTNGKKLREVNCLGRIKISYDGSLIIEIIPGHRWACRRKDAQPEDNCTNQEHTPCVHGSGPGGPQ